MLPTCNLYAKKIMRSIHLCAPKYFRSIVFAPETESNLREILVYCAKIIPKQQKFIQFCNKLQQKILALTLFIKFKQDNAFSFRMELANNKVQFTIRQM